MKPLENPNTALAAFIAPNATIVGRVELGKDSSVWFGAILRGDNDLISIGEASNVQDGTIIHTDDDMPLRVGARVTIGHAAVLHGCTVGDESLIGIGAVLLNGSNIPRHCVVGARSLVTEGKTFPERSLIIGSPARAIRTLTDEEIAGIRTAAAHYVQNARRFAQWAGAH
jgi:carbonic anhydrase/acetyltransferase-like protein (isoleucine patch superfamily)